MYQKQYQVLLCVFRPTGIRIRTLKLLPALETRLADPSLTVNGRTLTFLTTLRCLHYLEYDPAGSCTVYDYDGNVLEHPEVSGETVTLSGCPQDTVTLNAKDLPLHESRAAVTIRLLGEALR